MISRGAFAAAFVLLLEAPAAGHELDEYVQATLISLERDHADLQLRLLPGAEVFAKVFAAIDTDTDGVISDREQQAYARRVVADLALRLDKRPVTAELLSVEFPAIGLMKEGIGEIHIALRAPVLGAGPAHKLVLENHHQRAIAAYLVNCLTPRDPSLHIVSQHRSADQSRYELDYTM
jgi:hypothetical protein